MDGALGSSASKKIERKNFISCLQNVCRAQSGKENKKRRPACKLASAPVPPLMRTTRLCSPSNRTASEVLNLKIKPGRLAEMGYAAFSIPERMGDDGLDIRKPTVRIHRVPVKIRMVASASTRACRSSVRLPSEHRA